MGILDSPPQSTQFRDTSDAISPTWLNGPVGSRWRYAMAILWDAMADASGYAVRARFPSLCPPDALPWLSQDRQIDRGFAETDDHFRKRLIRWLDAWRFAATVTGELLAMRGETSPVLGLVRTVDNSGNWYSYAAGFEPWPDGQAIPTPPTFQRGHSGAWNWDGASDPFYGTRTWWRMWVIVYASGIYATPSKTWGGFNWGDGTCWGWAGTVGQSSALTSLCAKWRAAHCWIPFVLVTYDGTMFNPSGFFGDPTLPDANWGHYGKIVADGTWGQIRVPARPACNVASLLDGAGLVGPTP